MSLQTTKNLQCTRFVPQKEEDAPIIFLIRQKYPYKFERGKKKKKAKRRPTMAVDQNKPLSSGFLDLSISEVQIQ